MPISAGVILRNQLATELFCEALRSRPEQFSLVVRGLTSQDFIKEVAEKQPDVVVVTGAQREPANGIAVARQVRVASPHTRVILLIESSDRQQVVEAFSAGVTGLLSVNEPFDTVCKCIRCVHEGQLWASTEQLQWATKALADREPARLVSAKGVPLLTKREDEIVQMVTEGMPTIDVAARLKVTPHTVRNHLFRIYEKLGISSRIELILYALSRRQG